MKKLRESSDNSEIWQEFAELKDMVKNLSVEISRIRGSASISPIIDSRRVPNKFNNDFNFSCKKNIISILIEQGVKNETAQTISSFAIDQLSDVELRDSEKVYSFLHNIIADIISVKPLVFRKNNSQRRIALLGPTGVGKTTTLAKIAASYFTKISNSIALITIDTYRIAAVEQLKVYGELMHLPVDVVITPQQLRKALNRHSDKGLVLIDTAGKNPKDIPSLDELQTFLHPSLEIEKHLVLSAISRENELIQTLNLFNQIGIDSTIFTKIDECTNLGALLNILIHNNCTLSYITNGQRVPEDLVEADKKYIAQLIVPIQKES